MAGDRGRWAKRWLPAAAVSIGMVLTAVPLLAIASRSLLVRTGAYPHPSFGGFGALFADPRIYDAVENTIIAGVCTTVLSLILGFCLAFLVNRTDLPARRILGAANLLPFFLSPYAGALAWIFLLAPHDGIITTWAFETHHVALHWLDIYSVGGVIFVLTLFHTPYVCLLMTPALRDMDTAFEDTARVHGASFWYTLFHITIPLVTPSLRSAALIVFVTSAGLLDVPLALGLSRGIPFIPTEIYTMARGSLGEAACFAVAAVIASSLLIGSRRRRTRLDATVGDGYQIRTIHLGWPMRVAAWLLEALYLGAAVLLPLLALLMVALTNRWFGRFHWAAMTARNFDAILAPGDLHLTAIDNSLILGLAGATIGISLAMLQGYYLTRGTPSRSRPLRRLLARPFGVPAVAVGLGYMILVSYTPLFGTLLIILIACVARFLPFATRNVNAMMLGIDPELKQIARTSGATWNQTVWGIVVPLIRPSLLTTWLILFVVFFRELGATILLYAQGTETIGVGMMVLSEASPGEAAALALVQMSVLLLAFLLFQFNRAPPDQRLAQGLI